MAQDKSDLQCTELEKSKIVGALAGAVDFNPEACFHQMGTDFYFIPENIAGGDNAARAAAVIKLVKFVLAHS